MLHVDIQRLQFGPIKSRLLCATEPSPVYPGAPTADLPWFTIGGMNTMMPPPKRTWSANLLLYGLALSLVLLAPVLGALAAAVAFWQALLAGSIWYLPLGLVLVLAAIAMVYSHKLFDLALLGLVVVAAITWFKVDSPLQGRLLDAIEALAPQTGLMTGVLVVMVLALVLIHVARRSGRW